MILKRMPGIFLLGLSLPAAANEFEFTFVPIGGSVVNGGQLVEIEAFLTNVSPTSYEVISVQIDVNCTLDPLGAATGTITTGSADEDPMSTVVVHATSSGGIPRVIPGEFATSGQNSCFAVQTYQLHPVVIPSGATRYMATLMYRVSDCATGQHQLELECDLAGTPCDGKMTDVSSRTRIIVDDQELAGYNYSTLVLNAPAGTCCDGSTCLADNMNPLCCQQNYPGAQTNLDRVCSAPNACRCITAADCEDEIPCTLDQCDLSGVCFHTPNHASCSDGVFCNGAEICDLQLGCLDGSDPCQAPALCEESIEQCEPCLIDSDCDDGFFCTGMERCDFATGQCGPGLAPCPDPPPQYPQQDYDCDEVNKDCELPLCLFDGHCDDLNPCNGQEVCDTDENLCVLGAPVVCDDGDPCNGREECDPMTAQCLPGTPPCDDGVFCNGLEVCDPESGCFPGAPPCAEGLECDEERDECFFPGIPTVSAWGLAALSLCLAIGAKVRFSRPTCG